MRELVQAVGLAGVLRGKDVRVAEDPDRFAVVAGLEESAHLDEGEVEVLREELPSPAGRLARLRPASRFLQVPDEGDVEEAVAGIHLDRALEIGPRVAADGRRQMRARRVGGSVVGLVAQGRQRLGRFGVAVERPQVQAQQVAPTPVRVFAGCPAQDRQGLGAVGEGEGGIGPRPQQFRVAGQEGAPGRGHGTAAHLVREFQQACGIAGQPPVRVAHGEFQQRLPRILAPH